MSCHVDLNLRGTAKMWRYSTLDQRFQQFWQIRLRRILEDKRKTQSKMSASKCKCV